MLKILDSWAVRRWALWPWCALRRHPGTFWLASRWHFPDGPGPVTITAARCSCGRRIRRDGERVPT